LAPEHAQVAVDLALAEEMPLAGIPEQILRLGVA
jgi:hypothetical protein